MMIVFWGGLALVVVLLIRGFGADARRDGATPEPSGTPAPSPPDPAQTLRDRFARGEIDEDEFRQRLRVLEETAG